MYSGQRVTLVVKNPKAFERYFLDYLTAQATLTPDVASSIVQGFMPSLGKLSEFHGFDFTYGQQAAADQCAAPEIKNAAAPTVGHVGDVVPAFRKCLGQLAKKAIGIYTHLERFVAPDSLIPNETADDMDLSDVRSAVSDFLKSEFAFSTKISAIAGDANLKSSAPDAPAILELTDLQKPADAVANDLLGYSQRITDLEGFDNGSDDCVRLVRVTDAEKGNGTQCVAITTRPDDERAYHIW